MGLTYSGDLSELAQEERERALALLRQDASGEYEDDELDEGGDSSRSRSSSEGSTAVPILSSPSDSSSVTIDDFERIATIGKGGYAQVLLVRRRGSTQNLAMKIIRKDLVKLRSCKNRMIDERDLMAYFGLYNHPFLIRLHYAFQDERSLYLVTDFASGGEIFTHMVRDKKFSVERSRLYGYELALALLFLHSRGVIFRDLKPENILVGADGHLLLTDFGLSRRVLSGDVARSFVGTPCYVAPEMILASLQQPASGPDVMSERPHNRLATFDHLNDKGSPVVTKTPLAPVASVGPPVIVDHTSSSTPSSTSSASPSSTASGDFDVDVDFVSDRPSPFQDEFFEISIDAPRIIDQVSDSDEPSTWSLSIEGGGGVGGSKDYFNRTLDGSLNRTIATEDPDPSLSISLSSPSSFTDPSSLTEESGGYSFSVDWFAYGILMYEFLCGGHPFYHPNQQITFQNILYRDVGFSQLAASAMPPPDAVDFLVRLLDKNPKSRLTGSDVLNHPFFASINREDVLNKRIVPEFVPGEGIGTQFIPQELLELDPYDNDLEISQEEQMLLQEQQQQQQQQESATMYSFFTFNEENPKEFEQFGEEYWRIRKDERAQRRRGNHHRQGQQQQQQAIDSLQMESTMSLLQGFTLSFRTRKKLGLERDRGNLTPEQADRVLGMESDALVERRSSLEPLENWTAQEVADHFAMKFGSRVGMTLLRNGIDGKRALALSIPVLRRLGVEGADVRKGIADEVARLDSLVSG